MLTLVSDNVMSLLSSMGFADDPSGGPNEIVIERFDHWSNPQGEATLTLTCACGSAFVQQPEAAA
jgi:hypothetical protein